MPTTELASCVPSFYRDLSYIDVTPANQQMFSKCLQREWQGQLEVMRQMLKTGFCRVAQARDWVARGFPKAAGTSCQLEEKTDPRQTNQFTQFWTNTTPGAL